MIKHIIAYFISQGIIIIMIIIIIAVGAWKGRCGLICWTLGDPNSIINKEIASEGGTQTLHSEFTLAAILHGEFTLAASSTQ